MIISKTHQPYRNSLLLTLHSFHLFASSIRFMLRHRTSVNTPTPPDNLSNFPVCTDSSHHLLQQHTQNPQKGSALFQSHKKKISFTLFFFCWKPRGLSVKKKQMLFSTKYRLLWPRKNTSYFAYHVCVTAVMRRSWLTVNPGILTICCQWIPDSLPFL